MIVIKGITILNCIPDVASCHGRFQRGVFIANPFIAQQKTGINRIPKGDLMYVLRKLTIVILLKCVKLHINVIDEMMSSSDNMRAR